MSIRSYLSARMSPQMKALARRFVQADSSIQSNEKWFEKLPGEPPRLGDRIDPPYFHGIYKSFVEVPTTGPNPFDLDPWLDTATFQLKELLARTQSPNFVTEAHLWPFFALTANLCAKRGSIRVLDFGGGVGDNFVQWHSVAPERLKKGVEYHIVDTRRNCEIGKELLRQFGDSVQFHSADQEQGMERGNSEEPMKYDVVLFCGVLQYVANWKTVLGNIASRTNEYVYITRMQLNRNVPTFYTQQFVAPGVGPWAGRFVGSVPVAVVNPSDIGDVLLNEGFEETVSMVLYDYQQAASNHPGPYSNVYQNMSIFKKRDLDTHN